MEVIKNIGKMFFHRALFGIGTWLISKGIVLAPDWEAVVMSGSDVLFGVLFMAVSVGLSHVWKKIKK